MQSAISHSVAVGPLVLSPSRWAADCKWGSEGGASPDAGTGKDYNSWWRSWSRTGPARGTGGAAAPGSRAEPRLSGGAPPLGFQQVV